MKLDRNNVLKYLENPGVSNNITGILEQKKPNENH